MTSDTPPPSDAPDDPTPRSKPEAEVDMEDALGSSDTDKTYVAGDEGSATRLDNSGRPLDDEDLCGRTLDDFRVLRTLGQGGMAKVYLAEQLSLRRQVAMKVMQPEMLLKKDSVERFRSEAMAAAGLSHGNIVQVYTVGQADGMHYIAMEYVPGRNLRQLVRRNGPLPLAQAIKVMRQAASALRAAGEAGIVHRDIKPANLMVSRRGIIKVADFGLSIATGLDRNSGDLTAVGQTVGTPRYMSPEQVEGRPTDHRSDIYSLGVTFYYILSGRSPFDGSTPVQIALQHLKSEAPSLMSLRPDLPPELAGLVHRMMSKKPADRPESAAEVVEQLRRLSRQYGETEADESIRMAVDASSDATVSQPSLRRRLVKLLGSQAAAVRSPRYLILPLIACLGLGLLAGVAMRPRDPFDTSAGASRVPRAESIEEQYIDAMFDGSPEAFVAVENYWPYDAVWTERARQQLLLQLVRDDRQRVAALDLIDVMEQSQSEGSSRIALAAKLVLAANRGDAAEVRDRLPTVTAFDETLPQAWREAVEDVRRRTAGPGGPPRR